ncbi:LLM class flavin-dependent oxidoreductase [Desertimonas flava]|uniref:LLM class flavin-dependent oxidoreductase n=1 Tax=Desertimonas flava TaxID=2064846 RepID=UPI0019693E0D|nr:LLM class flavin-dependent oxidoreductase [Desertimonas flava]
MTDSSADADFNGANGSKHPLKFGVFLPPMHPTGQNPTLSMHRDLKLAEHLDELGFDEFWVGEHHSSGFETIASPEVFIAAAAQRTQRIKLGTGVNSLPYHHPLILADRILMLDHLTKGRMMFGAGPGQLASDAAMLGIVVDEQRRMMEEAFEVIMALFRGETVSAETDWFKVVEGRLQLRPYSNFDIAVAASISPSGPKLAGRHGVGLLSVAATNPAGFENLAGHWKVMEEQAAEAGRTVDRGKWRMMGPMHIAESEQQALDDCRYGFERVIDYLGHVIPTAPSAATDYEGRIREMNDTGAGVVGTPDMAIAQIQRLIDQSGGFGTYLVFGGDLADWPATLRSYELFAQYVMPHFQDQLAPPQQSYDWIVGTNHQFVLQTLHAIDKSRQDYAAERGEDAPELLSPQ